MHLAKRRHFAPGIFLSYSNEPRLLQWQPRICHSWLVYSLLFLVIREVLEKIGNAWTIIRRAGWKGVTTKELFFSMVWGWSSVWYCTRAFLLLWETLQNLGDKKKLFLAELGIIEINFYFVSDIPFFFYISIFSLT